jgi:glycosyltransferase involved in cell wall biosynthesis
MERKLRVLFMQSQSYFGSDSMMHSQLMRHYDRERTDVYVACNRGTRSRPSPSLQALQDIPNLRVLPMNFGPTLFGQTTGDVIKSVSSALPLAANLVRLAWFVRRHRIDIIHGTEKPRDAFYAVLLAKMTGARAVVHLHVACADWISPLVRWAMHEAAALVGVSRFVANSVIGKGYRPEIVHVILNGIDAGRWDPMTGGESVRKEFGIAPDQPVLAAISRLFHWKGHLDLVRALASVKREVPSVRLFIVGEDDPRATPGRGSMTAELKSLVADLGLQEHVIFTGFRSDVAKILAACDVFAMPTFEEPCAVAFLEAMAMARPIVALRSGGTPEIVPEGRAGLLSDPGDLDALAANIVMLIGDPNVRRRMGAFGRQWVETRLTPQRMAEDGLAIYRSLA